MGDSEVNLRLPTLELYSALHGGALSLGGRTLSKYERRDAEYIFEKSIDLDKVRIVRAIVANAPTTLGNYIRIGMHGRISRQTLIHELAHIWQYQTMGTAYISDSVYHQVGATITTGSRNAAYKLSAADLSAGSIYDLTAEKQARVVENYYADPKLRTDPVYEKFIGEVRRARPLPENIIQEEAAFGPGMGHQHLLQDDPGGIIDRAPGTVPLVRIEFDLF